MILQMQVTSLILSAFGRTNYYELIPNTPKLTESNPSMNWTSEINIKPAHYHFMALPVFTKAGHKFDFVHCASGSRQNEEKFIEYSSIDYHDKEKSCKILKPYKVLKNPH